MSESNVELVTMELSELLTAAVSGVPDVDLALKVGQASNLLEQLRAAHSEWLDTVQVEISRQDAERKAKLASVGLGTAAPKAVGTTGKRGRKSNAEKAAEPAKQDEGADVDLILDAE